MSGKTLCLGETNAEGLARQLTRGRGRGAQLKPASHFSENDFVIPVSQMGKWRPNKLQSKKALGLDPGLSDPKTHAVPFTSSKLGMVLCTRYYLLCLFLGTSRSVLTPPPCRPSYRVAAGNLWVATWDESFEVLPWLTETDTSYKYWEILPYRARILKLALKARFANSQSYM